MHTPRWTALVIFYIINLHTVANHSDDNHYHTTVNIMNCNVLSVNSLCTRVLCTKMEVRCCNNANSPGSQAGAFFTLTRIASEPSSSNKYSVYTADSFLNGIADTIQKA